MLISFLDSENNLATYTIIMILIYIIYIWLIEFWKLYALFDYIFIETNVNNVYAYFDD